MRATLAALALACAAGLAWAQEAGTTDSADIVVTGVRLREMAQDFVGQVSRVPQAEDQFARWSDRICPGAVGLSQADGQRVIDRIALRAHQVGLRPGASGCRANVMVIYAPDSDALSRQIVDQRRDLLGYYTQEAMVTAGRDALEAFASTPRPVRWWHVAQTTSSDGEALGNADSRPGQNTREAVAVVQAQNAGDAGAGGGGDGSGGAISAQGAGSFRGMEGVRSHGSRMRRATRQDLNYVLIVVDARRVAGVPTDAWIDYVAMVSLAQFNPDAPAQPVPTILNLFKAPQGAPAAMTDWDLAYLQGLYRATRDAANSRQQTAQIAEHIASSVAAPPAQ